MDNDLLNRARTEHDRLRKGRALDPSTLAEYRRKYARYAKWAETNSLPTSFTAPEGRALTLDDVRIIIAGAAEGGFGNEPPPAREPVAPATLDGMLAALRHAHLAEGLTWVGDRERTELRELRKAYARAHGRPRVASRPMSVTETGQLFDKGPRLAPGSNLESSIARALGVQAGLTIAEAGELAPESITVTSAGVLLASDNRRWSLPCIAAKFPEPLGAVTCAHCLLTLWLADQPRGPLLDYGPRVFVRDECQQLSEAARLATFDRDVLRSDDGPFGPTGAALVWDRKVVAWIEARALILPMRARGLRHAVFAQMMTPQVRFHDDGATLVVYRSATDQQGTVINLARGQGTRCPVEALAVFDRWVRVFLPERKSFINLALHGPLAIPAEEKLGPRALYHRTALWLREAQAVQDEAADGPGGPPRRERLTLMSPRRGYAQHADALGHDIWEIKEALGHKKESTTLAFLEPDDDAADQVFRSIAAGDGGAA